VGRRKKKQNQRILCEANWHSSSNIEQMLEIARMSLRKRRLFACACCRRLWQLLPEDGCRELEVAEGMIDREVSNEEHNRGWEAVIASRSSEGLRRTPVAVRAVLSAKVGGAGGASVTARHAVGHAGIRTEGEARAHQADLLRDIVGNPFRPVPIDPCWFSPELVALVADIYRRREFGRVPELAPMLERAGCTDLDILRHCRRAGEHVWGCWLVDLLLGRG
jgi:hypothetical protein